jgi:hypothetical protein
MNIMTAAVTATARPSISGRLLRSSGGSAGSANLPLKGDLREEST